MNKRHQTSKTSKKSDDVANPVHLRLLSWNIHDSNDSITGSKLSDKMFVKTTSQCDIICLQETKRGVKIPDFKCYNSNRPDSRSGGLCIGIKHGICSLVTPVSTKNFSHDIQAVRISRKLNSLTKDILLVNIYDSPINSSYKQKLIGIGKYEETLESLNNFLAIYRGDCHLILCGDFNARTGNENSLCIREDLMQNSLSSGDFMTMSNLPSNSVRYRCSKDQVSNSRGRALIELASLHNAKILNGTIIGDALGDFTCVNYKGQSVVDYFVASDEILQSFSSMRVQELTAISDHRPIICTLSAPCLPALLSLRMSASDFQDAPLGYKWKNGEDGSKRSFIRGQQNPSITARMNHLCSQSSDTPDDVYSLNLTLIQIIQNTAENTLEKKKIPSKKHAHNKSSWFDYDCRKAKRRTNKLAKRFCKTPNTENREGYFRQKKEYRKLLKKKKRSFFVKLNYKINGEKAINWEEFKKLKSYNKEPQTMDLQDLATFYKFFKSLYSEKVLPEDITSRLKESYESKNNSPQTINLLNDVLNKSISLDELSRSITKLKNGKASAEDCITNEFLKNCSPLLRKCIARVFNECLDKGVYPWNVALVTPLHKKGDKYNPDNYRAIAVGSNLGKLFANILLDRLISFRNSNCPDPINQLGFCKDAQTSDHIFVLNTCIQKHLSQGEYLYSCFIDFKKAFDTVCREALLYKLYNLGVRGKFFNCLHHMYTNSKAKIKLIHKISESLDVIVGTEQGHPMSPELFKCYLLELSQNLDKTNSVESPTLNSRTVTHLLWADDLVLLALSKESLQRLLDTVHEFCTTWGLTVNMSKTAVLVFNKSGRQLKTSIGFCYGNYKIQSAKEYCYLGIVYTLSGSLAKAQNELRTKGLRAYFSLKRMVDTRSLTVRSLFRLFDALIVPIITYGCQLWLFETNFLKMIATNTLHCDARTSINKISNDPLENLHLKFLKWTLGLTAKATNLVCWGDTGRVPIAANAIKQVLGYVRRLETLSKNETETLAGNAFKEQQQLSLAWYNRVQDIKMALEIRETTNPTVGRRNVHFKFSYLWKLALPQYSKLQFYAMVKRELSFETYLTIAEFERRKSLAKLRASNHQLNCETGRYLSQSKKGSADSEDIIQKKLGGSAARSVLTQRLRV